MPTRFTSLGCKVETTYIIQPNGQYREQIVLSVDPASDLSLAIEESARRTVGTWTGPAANLHNLPRTRVRATKHGFELVRR